MRTVKIYGKSFEVADEPADFWGWVEEGRYNSEWTILDKFLRPEHTFLDLGAWVGSHSLFASTRALAVLAVEPDPVAYAILAENSKANPGNIHTFPIAMTDKEGTITLGSGLLGASTTRANRHEGAGIGPWEPGQQCDVPCTTLRNFFDDHHSPTPLFIKMDVEGSEEDILKDVEFFKEWKPTLYLELHPFWWRDGQTAWDSVRKVAGLYRQVLDIHMRPVDLNSLQPRALIVTNEAS